jgi:hypothetical protein
MSEAHFVVTTKSEFIPVSASAKALGSLAGERVLREALERVSKASFDEAGAVLAIDLAKVKLATTSYIKAGMLPLFLSGQRYSDQASNGLVSASSVPALNIYPVFCNVDDEVLDTMNEVFAGRRLPFLVGDLHDGDLGNGRVFGFLDEALVRTIRLIHLREQVTALELVSEFSEEDIKPTAWNNRLNDLWRLRLLRRIKRGKAWWYKPVTKELTYGR